VPRLRPISIFVALFLTSLPTRASEQHPGTPPPDYSTVVAGLSDPDPQRRDAASLQLWSAGRSAEPALRAAAAGDDPEAAERARGILEKINFGLSPHSSPELFKLLTQYRSGSDSLRSAALDGLASQQTPGLRILVGLLDETHGAAAREAILKAMSFHSREAAGLLIAEGNRAVAGEFLASAADAQGPTDLRDWAAFELLNGTLEAKLAEIKHTAPAEDSAAAALRLALFARASGDLATATAAAAKADNDALLDALLVDQQAWGTMAQRLSGRGDVNQSIAELGYLAACQRLNGDETGLQRTISAIEDFGSAHTEAPQVLLGAQALFLNDRPDEAIALLMRQHQWLAAADYLTPRLMLKEALSLPNTNDKAEKPDPRLKAKLAVALNFVGQKDEARQTLSSAAGCAAGWDAQAWGVVVEAARDTNDTNADKYLIDAIADVAPTGDIATLLSRAEVPEPALAARWLDYLRGPSNKPQPAAVQRMLALARGSAGPHAVDEFAEEILTAAQKLPRRPEPALLELAADTFAAAQDSTQAQASAARLVADSPTVANVSRLADLQSAAGQWSDAAGNYDRAWDLDRLQPVPLFMEALALRKLGRTADADRLTELAHWIPLGNEASRHDLMDAATRNHCDGEAARERELILRVGDPSSWERADALRLAGDEANGKRDHAAAATLWERSFIENLSTRWEFIQPWANVNIPALIERTHALASLHAGDIAAAAAMARSCFDHSPADADTAIELINAFRDAGHTAEADDLFAHAKSFYSQLCISYPHSGQLQNLLAWTEAMTNRNLDEAIAHGRRAVELEPTNTASLDTLAEALFRRGDVNGAIAVMQKCIDLEPAEPHHRQQMQRFRAALPTTQKDAAK
jgi:tetratricopeptide (TPR) repeat protein